MHINRHSYVKTSRRSAGFTLLELMVASGVFAVAMLVVAVAVIRTTDMYYKGVTSSKTQAAARAVMDQISQSIELSRQVSPRLTSGAINGYCVDDTAFAFTVGQQVTDTGPSVAKHQGYHGLLVATGTNCTAAIPAALTTYLASPGTSGTPPVGSPGVPNGARELLGSHMRLSALDITRSTGSIFTIHVRVIYGDDTVLAQLPVPGLGSTSWSGELCSGSSGTQFCAVSDLTTTVEQRLE